MYFRQVDWLYEGGTRCPAKLGMVTDAFFDSRTRAKMPNEIQHTDLTTDDQEKKNVSYFTSNSKMESTGDINESSCP